MGKQLLIKILQWVAGKNLACAQLANDCVDALNDAVPLFVIRERRRKAEADVKSGAGRND